MRIGDTKIINNLKYLILDIIEKNDNIYVMVTRLDENEEPTMGEYEVFKIIKNTWLKEENKYILEDLLPIFTQNIRKMVNELVG